MSHPLIWDHEEFEQVAGLDVDCRGMTQAEIDLRIMVMCWRFGVQAEHITPERKHVILMEPGKERTRWLG